MLVPKELKFEHSGGVKAMSDEELERALEVVKELIAKRDAGANAKVIEGEAEVELAGVRKRRHQDAQGLRSASPKVLEPVWRHFGVPDRMLDVPVAEVVCRARVSWPSLARFKPQA